jgi:hypothetical protein
MSSGAGKNPAAAALGGLGGLTGGKARAATLSKEELSKIGKRAREAGIRQLSARRRRETVCNAAAARWGRVKKARS